MKKIIHGIKLISTIHEQQAHGVPLECLGSVKKYNVRCLSKKIDLLPQYMRVSEYSRKLKNNYVSHPGNYVLQIQNLDTRPIARITLIQKG